MLLSLAQYLAQYFDGFRVFQYLTFRAILGVLTALSISFLVGPAMIRQLSKYKIGQNVRDDGPKSHFSKAGTPTMGGALILVSIVISTLLWADLGNRYIWVILLVTLAFGVIGFIDDFTKTRKQRSLGLGGWAKIAGQALVATVFAVLALSFPDDDGLTPASTMISPARSLPFG